MLFEQLFCRQLIRQQKTYEKNVGIDRKTKIIEIKNKNIIEKRVLLTSVLRTLFKESIKKIVLKIHSPLDTQSMLRTLINIFLQI